MNQSQSQKGILVTAWAVILTITLSKIILQEIFHYPVSENLQYGLVALIVIAGFALTYLWKTIRPLRPFFGLFIVLVGAQWLVYTQVETLPNYRSWLRNPSFNIYMLAEQALNLLVTLIVIAYLFILKKQRQSFFLARGDIAAPVEPVKWLGVKEGTRWNKFGRILALCISLGTFSFLVIAGRPPLDILVKVLPFLPAVLLAAALNAFNEEMTYKASFLSVLENVVGKHQSLLLLAAYFGILHFYGIPYGIVGVLMAAFMGWLLGKSMLETRGLFWAWFIHFLQDVLIFLFLAIGTITPGGK
jgi:hypothetical protein